MQRANDSTESKVAVGLMLSIAVFIACIGHKRPLPTQADPNRSRDNLSGGPQRTRPTPPIWLTRNSSHATSIEIVAYTAEREHLRKKDAG